MSSQVVLSNSTSSQRETRRASCTIGRWVYPLITLLGAALVASLYFLVRGIQDKNVSLIGYSGAGAFVSLLFIGAFLFSLCRTKRVGHHNENNRIAEIEAEEISEKNRKRCFQLEESIMNEKALSVQEIQEYVALAQNGSLSAEERESTLQKTATHSPLVCELAFDLMQPEVVIKHVHWEEGHKGYSHDFTSFSTKSIVPGIYFGSRSGESLFNKLLPLLKDNADGKWNRSITEFLLSLSEKQREEFFSASQKVKGIDLLSFLSFYPKFYSKENAIKFNDVSEIGIDPASSEEMNRVLWQMREKLEVASLQSAILECDARTMVGRAKIKELIRMELEHKESLWDGSLEEFFTTYYSIYPNQSDRINDEAIYFAAVEARYFFWEKMEKKTKLRSIHRLSNYNEKLENEIKEIKKIEAILNAEQMQLFYRSLWSKVGTLMTIFTKIQCKEWKEILSKMYDAIGKNLDSVTAILPADIDMKLVENEIAKLKD